MKMSLLGPDDFGLDRKDRKKKLAKDLSPELQKDIGKWLDRADDPEAFKRISEMVGPEQARLLIARRRKRKAELGSDDDLIDQ